MKYSIQIVIIFIFLAPTLLFSQSTATIGTKDYLDKLSEAQIPNLNKEVDLSVNDLPLKEFVRILANNTGINIVVDNNANWKINNNFSRVKAKDVLFYLCNEYGLQVISTGSILQLKMLPKDQGTIEILYFSESRKITIDSKNIPLKDFFKELSAKCGVNFSISPNLKETRINCFINSSDFDNAIKKIGYENNLNIEKENDNLYIVDELIDIKNTPVFETKKNRIKSNLRVVNDHGLFSIFSENEPLDNILSEMSANADFQFFYLTPVDLKVSLNVTNEEIEDILNLIFKASDYSYKIKGEKIFIGNRKENLLKSCELFKFNNRRVDSITFQIPKPLINSIEVEEFVELNSLILWGNTDDLVEFKDFLKQLDQSVPLVIIDVIIIDVSKIYDIETGLEAGLSSTAKSTLGLINPGLDLLLSSSSVNNVLNSIGLANLGRVAPNFYVKLKALETDGVIEIRSTPQLSTLNGHSAFLSIGKVEYYREELSNIYGSMSPQLQTQYQYKPVEAKLKIEIRPFVTGNGEVILDISFSQSDFTERISEFAPPGVVSRDFQSKISVKNQEMILLGGLEEVSTEDNRKGWPILSRLPVLKWIFASKSTNSTKKHLSVFIKPTILY
jgi:type IV pilus assembly protein PilQ